MAFQVGTRVDPRLGALDFSGFTNAANIQAASLAQLGATIGGAITERKERKKKKELNAQAQKTVFGYLRNNPESASIFGLDSENLELEDTKPFVDVMGAAPSIKLIAQLEIASMKAGQPSLPTIKEVTDFNEFLATQGGMKDLILKNGMLYDDDVFVDDPIPFDDPIVQRILGTAEGQKFLTGYANPILIETTDDEGSDSDQDEDKNETVIPVDTVDPIKPVGLRLPNRISSQRGFGY